MRIFFRFESVIHWGKKWFFVQMTHFWKFKLSKSIFWTHLFQIHFLKLKLSQNTVDYLNLWYYSKRKISIDRLEIMIFQEFVKWGASFSMVISSEFRMGSIETITIKKMHPTLFLGIDYWKLKVSIRNYLPPQYLAASKIFTWNFIF